MNIETQLHTVHHNISSTFLTARSITMIHYSSILVSDVAGTNMLACMHVYVHVHMIVHLTLLLQWAAREQRKELNTRRCGREPQTQTQAPDHRRLWRSRRLRSPEKRIPSKSWVSRTISHTSVLLAEKRNLRVYHVSLCLRPWKAGGDYTVKFINFLVCHLISHVKVLSLDSQIYFH